MAAKTHRCLATFFSFVAKDRIQKIDPATGRNLIADKKRPTGGCAPVDAARMSRSGKLQPATGSKPDHAHSRIILATAIF
jgi:hypothetical protein